MSPNIEILPHVTAPVEKEFVQFCEDVANAVGPSLVFTLGHVRLGMSNEMVSLYKKYVTKETT